MCYLKLQLVELSKALASVGSEFFRCGFGTVPGTRTRTYPAGVRLSRAKTKCATPVRARNDRLGQLYCGPGDPDAAHGSDLYR